MARGLKFRIQKVEGLYYPCSKNKGADQLRGYREADLRLCFRICKKPVFSRRGSILAVAMSKFDTTLLLCDAAALLCNRQTKYMQEQMEIMLIGPTRFLVLKKRRNI